MRKFLLCKIFSAENLEMVFLLRKFAVERGRKMTSNTTLPNTNTLKVYLYY